MRINIELPEELHTALKVRAAVEGITLKQLIINILKTDSWNTKKPDYYMKNCKKAYLINGQKQ